MPTGETGATGASAQETDPFVRDGVASALARRLRNAVARVGVEEYHGQDEHFDQDSRLGRELLYLISNDEWIRATRESITLDAADTVATSIQVHVDLGRITHEAFRDRIERVWLPLVVLPPPLPQQGSGGVTETEAQVTPTPVASDQSGNLLPALPQAEARRWLAAALAEIVLNLAPVRLEPGHDDVLTRGLAREQRLLLSAALYRVMRRRGSQEVPEIVPARAGADPDGTIETARRRLARLLDAVVTSLERSTPETRDPTALIVQRAGRIIHAVSSPTTLVVVAVPPTALSTVYTVELPHRSLHARIGRFHGPRARIEVDALLPGTEADRAIVVRLPDGVSFLGHDDPRIRPRAARATVEGAQPRSLRQVVDLVRQLRQEEKELPDPVARCLIDFTLARLEVAREALRHYGATAEGARAHGRRTAEWLDEVRDGLEAIPGDPGRPAAAMARDVARRVRGVTDREPLFRINESDVVSPSRAHIQMHAVENRTVRATPIGAAVELDVVADRSAPLHAARYSGYMSLLLLGALLVCWLLFVRASTAPEIPDAQVLASVLTLFAAVQAGRIQHPDRSSLRGLLISSGSWLVIASIMPTVLLGVALAFDHSSVLLVVAAVVVQTVVLGLMYLPQLTGQPWRRWRVVNAGLVDRPPRLRMATGPKPDYRRTAVLLSSWWRSTTAAALQLGTEAHGYVILQAGPGIPDPFARGTPNAVPRTSVMGRGLDFVTTRLPRTNGDPDGGPAHPANILAMLRTGAPRQAVSFIVFREEPEPDWQPGRVPVELDIDRLIAQEAPLALIDVYVGLERYGLRNLDQHPVWRLLRLARERRLQIAGVQLPATPPIGGSPGRHWTRATIGLRSNEVSRLDDLLVRISRTVGEAGGPGVDLLIDMSTLTPPRRFLGEVEEDAGGTPVPEPLRPFVLDVRRSLADSDDQEWVTLAMCDYAHEGVEARILQDLVTGHPGLELAGLTVSRLFGTTVVVALGRRPRGLAPPLPRASRSGATVLLERVASAELLGRLPQHGVLLEVRAQYSDRAGLFLALMQSLRHGVTRVTRVPDLPMELPYVHTEVADGRNATADIVIGLPAPATGNQFTADVLDRIEKDARRVLAHQQDADREGDDLGLVHAPRVSIGIRLLSAQSGPPASRAPRAVRVIDLDSRTAARGATLEP